MGHHPHSYGDSFARYKSGDLHFRNPSNKQSSRAIVDLAEEIIAEP